MRATTRSGVGTTHLRRRTIGVGLVAAAVVAVLIDPGPAQAATIPTPPAACKVSNAPGDPTMTSFARTPGTVDVRTTGKHISFTVKVTDSTADITSIFVTVQSPKIGTVQRNGFAILHRSSGTARNGTWKGSAAIGRWTNNGTWKITQVFISDAGGGGTLYAPTGFSQKPWNSSWPKTFSVTSKPDVKTPTVSALTLSRSSVNTSSKTQKITVTVKAKDDLSGISVGAFVSASVRVGTRSFSTGAFLVRKSGTPRNGTFRGAMIVPMWVGKGTHVWSLSLSVSDAAGNFLSLNTAELKAKHLTSTFKVTSKTDATNPALKGLTYTPKSVNALTKPQKVAVTLKASDTVSGVGFARVTFTSPSGFSSSGGLVRKSGTPGSGTWKGSVTIPRCSEPGVWTVSVDLIDRSGNSSHFTTAQVKAKHFSTNLTVKALDATPPRVTGPKSVTTTGAITLTFSEATLWKQSAATTLSVFDYSKSFSALPGTWTCKNASGGTVACDANGANVKTASFKPSSALGHGETVYVQSNAAYPMPSGIYDTSGNGLTSLFVSTTVS